MDTLDQIEQKYGFALPDAYRSMSAAGWLDAGSPDPLYFWLLGAKWLPLSEILEYEPEDYQKPGFIPFAAESNGSFWCWWPEAHPDLVVLCPHDCYDGEFYAPSFVGFIYRRLLDYAGCVPRQKDQEARDYLRQAAARLIGYFPDAWTKTLNMLASAEPVELRHGKLCGRGFATYRQIHEIVQRDLSFPLLDETFQWMYPLSESEAAAAEAYRKISLEADRTRPVEKIIAQLEAAKARCGNGA